MSTVGWQHSSTPFYSSPQCHSFNSSVPAGLGSSFAASSSVKAPLGLDQGSLFPSNDHYYAAVTAKDIQKIVDVTTSNPGLMRSVTSLGRMNESHLEPRKNFTTEFNLRIPDASSTQGYSPQYLSKDPVNKPFNTLDRLSTGSRSMYGTHAAGSDLGSSGPTIHIPVSDKPTYNTHQKYLFRDNTTSHLELKGSPGGTSNKYMFKDHTSTSTALPLGLEQKSPSKDLSPIDVKPTTFNTDLSNYRNSSYENSLRTVDADLKKAEDYNSQNYRPWLGYGNLNNSLSRPGTGSDLSPPIFTKPSHESRLNEASLASNSSRYGDSTSLRFPAPPLKYESQYRVSSAGIPTDYSLGRSATSADLSVSPRSFNRTTSAPAVSLMEEMALCSPTHLDPILSSSTATNKKSILKKVSSYADPTFTRTFLNDIPLLNGHSAPEKLPRLSKGGRGSKRVTFNMMCNRKHSYAAADQEEPYRSPYIW